MISNKPLVSIVIPCYNHENFVQDSIQSVIDQTYQNIEVILINDGSTDGSQELISSFQKKDKRIKHGYHRQPIHRQGCRNAYPRKRGRGCRPIRCIQ